MNFKSNFNITKVSDLFKFGFDLFYELFHFVLAELTEIMFEVEVFSHECVKFNNVKKMVFMNPLGTYFFILTVFKQRLIKRITITFNQRLKILRRLRLDLPTILKLIRHHYLLFKQKMRKTLIALTVDKLLPILQ